MLKDETKVFWNKKVDEGQNNPKTRKRTEKGPKGSKIDKNEWFSFDLLF